MLDTFKDLLRVIVFCLAWYGLVQFVGLFVMVNSAVAAFCLAGLLVVVLWLLNQKKR